MIGDDVPTDDFEVWPENAVVVELFCACQTQWVRSPNGKVMGLNYAAVDVVIYRRRFSLDADGFAGLQVMELAALEALSE